MTDIDKKNIYNELVNLLTVHCNTCLDKQQIDKILLCAFKLNLIDYAQFNEYDNVDELWESLARTLGVKLDGEMHVTSKKVCNCKNGVCAIC